MSTWAVPGIYTYMYTKNKVTYGKKVWWEEKWVDTFVLFCAKVRIHRARIEGRQWRVEARARRGATGQPKHDNTPQANATTPRQGDKAWRW